MTEEEKKHLFEDLIQLGVLKVHKEIWTEDEIIETVEGKYAEEEIGTTSDGVRYVKRLVQEYLMEKGYPFTQENVELAAKMMCVNDDGKLVKKHTHTREVWHHELENASDEEIRSFLDRALLKQVARLRMELLQNMMMEYHVRVIYDSMGGTDIDRLDRILAEESSRGWRLKTVFTNELGVSSSSVSTSVGTFGTNSTKDQVVLIFERPRILGGDKGAADLIDAIRLNTPQ